MALRNLETTYGLTGSSDSLVGTDASWTAFLTEVFPVAFADTAALQDYMTNGWGKRVYKVALQSGADQTKADEYIAQTNTTNAAMQHGLVTAIANDASVTSLLTTNSTGYIFYDATLGTAKDIFYTTAGSLFSAWRRAMK